MKKTFYILIILFTTFYNKAFAEAEFGFYIPLGFGVTFQKTSIDYRDVKPIYRPISINDMWNGELGLLAQAGYKFNFSNTNMLIKSVSLFFDFGYYFYSVGSRQRYKFDAFPDNISYSFDEILSFHSINIGIMPKLNFGTFSVGLGGGVRVPFAGYRENFDKYLSDGIDGLNTQDSDEYVSYSDLKEEFNHLISAYIKVTAEFKFPMKNKRIAPMLGFYFINDFGMNYNIDEINKITTSTFEGEPYFKKYRYSSYTFGVLLGIYFW